MAKRVARVKFIGEAPFIIPVVTYDNGEEEFVVGGGERELMAIRRSSEDVASSSLARPSQPLKLLQPNIKPLAEWMSQLSKNIVVALQRMTPQQPTYYRHEEAQQEIQRLQKEGKLYPECEDSSMLVTKCATCDRREICAVLREEERKRREEFDRMYGARS